jgi:predicted small lipoprotein YifL
MKKLIAVFCLLSIILSFASCTKKDPIDPEPITQNAPPSFDILKTKDIVLGNISDNELLASNLAENCIPANIDMMDVSSYDDFLIERRKMMAALIEKYYKGL